VITIVMHHFPSINPLIGVSEGLHVEFQGGHVALLGVDRPTRPLSRPTRPVTPSFGAPKSTKTTPSVLPDPRARQRVARRWQIRAPATPSWASKTLLLPSPMG
jgi:hypothetical protein